jgi:hypothetical protein
MIPGVDIEAYIRTFTQAYMQSIIFTHARAILMPKHTSTELVVLNTQTKSPRKLLSWSALLPVHLRVCVCVCVCVCVGYINTRKHICTHIFLHIRKHAAIDDDTMLVVTSDHGHVNVGGHGCGHAEIRNVPFVVYKKGSELKAHFREDRRFINESSDHAFKHMRSNLGCAGTLAALAGLSTPRHAMDAPFFDVLQAVVNSETSAGAVNNGMGCMRRREVRCSRFVY